MGSDNPDRSSPHDVQGSSKESHDAGECELPLEVNLFLRPTLSFGCVISKPAKTVKSTEAVPL